MSLFKQFKMDETKERDGIDVTYGANDDKTIPTFRLLRRSPSNQRYASTLAKETQKYQNQIRLDTLDKMQSDHIFKRVFCLSILVGWDNVQGEDGKLIPYTFDNAMQLMNLLPELYNDLLTQADKASLFLADTQETIAKN